MDLKGAFYKLSMVAWLLVVFGAWVAVDLGYTGSWLAFSDVPGGAMGGFAGAIVALFLGWFVLTHFQQRHETGKWRATGREAGLVPVGDGGSSSERELTGTVDGRTVTVRYNRWKMNRSSEGNGTWVTFTFGEAELAGPADDGVSVGRAGESVDAGGGTLDFDDVAETVSTGEGLLVAETNDLVLVGTSTAAVEAVDDGLSGEALRAIRDLSIGSLGDASGVVASWAEARNEELAEGGSSIVEYPVDNLVDRVPGDATTVTVETKTAIQDSDELRRFAEGVVAVADAFEEATARSSPTGLETD